MNDFVRPESSQKRPDSEAMSTERLESMSPIELANGLERMLDLMTEESYDPSWIDVYLNALDRKVPMPEDPNAEKAFKEFKEKLTPALPAPKVDVISVNTARRRPYKRAIITVAATIALIFTIMIGAQAAGLDVFGNLARWTDEVFHFVSLSSRNVQNSEYQIAFQQTLEDYGLPKELAPSWFPEGFHADGPEVWSDDSSQVVQLSLAHEDGRSFFVSVEHYTNEQDIIAAAYQKDTTPVEEYIQNGRRFYILSNINSTSAVWTDGNLVETIMGRLSVEEIKTIIDSIGG